MRAIAVINASGGTLKAAKEEYTAATLRTRLHDARIPAEVLLADPNRFEPALEEAVRQQPDLLIVGGGDGSVSTAARHLCGTSITLGILPLGTLNHFARDLGYSGELDQALDLLRDAHSLLVDAASVNGRVFINNCSIGLYPAAVQRRQELQQFRNYKKWPAMLRACVEVARNLKTFRVQIDSDGEVRMRRTPVVLISNNRYTGHLFSSSLRPRLDEGCVWLYTTRLRRALPLTRLLLTAALGRLDRADEFECWPARRVTILHQNMSVALGVDGELQHFASPLRVETKPAALHVLGSVKM